MSLDQKLPPAAHQVIGACMGIILCSWVVGAASEQVALIRLPATIILTVYMIAQPIYWLAKRRS